MKRDVDEMARDLTSAFCTEVKRHTTWRGGSFLPALWSVWLNTTLGQSVPATPDGRRGGRPLSHSAGPSLGVAREGPTAIIKSVTKLDFVDAANGSSLLLHLQPGLLKSAEGREKLEALIRTYFQRGGRTRMLAGCSLAHAGNRWRANRSHQALRVGMLRVVDDLFDRALLENLAAVEDDDVVGDLGDNGKVVCDVDRG